MRTVSNNVGRNGEDVDNPYAGRLFLEAQPRLDIGSVVSKTSRAALSYDLDFGNSGIGQHRFAIGTSRRQL